MTDEQFDALVERVCNDFPQNADLIREIAPSVRHTLGADPRRGQSKIVLMAMLLDNSGSTNEQPYDPRSGGFLKGKIADRILEGANVITDRWHRSRLAAQIEILPQQLNPDSSYERRYCSDGFHWFSAADGMDPLTIRNYVNGNTPLNRRSMEIIVATILRTYLLSGHPFNLQVSPRILILTDGRSTERDEKRLERQLAGLITELPEIFQVSFMGVPNKDLDFEEVGHRMGCHQVIGTPDNPDEIPEIMDLWSQSATEDGSGGSGDATGRLEELLAGPQSASAVKAEAFEDALTVEALPEETEAAEEPGEPAPVAERFGGATAVEETSPQPEATPPPLPTEEAAPQPESAQEDGPPEGDLLGGALDIGAEETGDQANRDGP